MFTREIIIIVREMIIFTWEIIIIVREIMQQKRFRVIDGMLTESIGHVHVTNMSFL
jgi:hypothetical protein